jgi:RNA polymerase sigma factor (sigma-70 family)
MKYKVGSNSVASGRVLNMRSSRQAPSKKRYMAAAMVLGTALSLGASAPASAGDPGQRAITDISRYCTACWRNARLPPDYWGDCTQEVFHRLLERVTPDAWGDVLQDEGDARREFIRAIDAVKKRTQRGQRRAGHPLSEVADTHDAQERRLADTRDAVHQAAAIVLTPRQQSILHMSFEGWSVHDIAGKLDLSAERVSDEKYKAIRRLREHLGVVSDEA